MLPLSTASEDSDMPTRTENPNTVKLRALMADHGINSVEVAEMLGRSPNTVRQWRSVKEQHIPDHMLNLLDSLLRLRVLEAAQ